MSTDSWGIEEGYEDALGRWRPTPQDTRRAILNAMHVDPSAPIRPAEALVRVVRPGQRMSLTGPADLVLEDGTVLRVDVALPPDLPLGYHALRPLNDGAATHLIVSPGRCYLPAAGATGIRCTCVSKRCRGPPRPVSISSAWPPPVAPAIRSGRSIATPSSG